MSKFAKSPFETSVLVVVWRSGSSGRKSLGVSGWSTVVGLFPYGFSRLVFDVDKLDEQFWMDI